MSTLRASLYVSVITTVLGGCSGKSVTNVNVNDTGGDAGETSTTTSQGGTTHTTTLGLGGTTASSAATGGVPVAGGTSASGGTSSSGGTSNVPTGGASAQGGTPSSGGSSALGGSSQGGTSYQGGSSAQGGASYQGGSSAQGGALYQGGTTGAGGSTASTTAALSCDGITGGYLGCLGSGCTVCNELVNNYPFYYKNHPNCSANLGCKTLTSTPTYRACSANCPAPTDEDDAYGGPTCDGAVGGWSGCLGSGCLVCSNLLVGFPRYLENHPKCAQNINCQQNQPAACSSDCPMPTNADK